jgi:outer membrane protein insertion porin family
MVENNTIERYPNNSLTINSRGEQLGATVYNKFSMELISITLKSSASIYALGFFRSRSSYPNFKAYPFDLSRSAELDYVYLCQHLDY